MYHGLRSGKCRAVESPRNIYTLIPIIHHAPVTIRTSWRLRHLAGQTMNTRRSSSDHESELFPAHGRCLCMGAVDCLHRCDSLSLASMSRGALGPEATPARWYWYAHVAAKTMSVITFVTWRRRRGFCGWSDKGELRSRDSGRQTSSTIRATRRKLPKFDDRSAKVRPPSSVINVSTLTRSRTQFEGNAGHDGHSDLRMPYAIWSTGVRRGIGDERYEFTGYGISMICSLLYFSSDSVNCILFSECPSRGGAVPVGRCSGRAIRTFVACDRVSYQLHSVLFPVILTYHTSAIMDRVQAFGKNFR